MKKPPTRRQLLAALAHLQTMVGRANGEVMNDRSPNRAAEVQATLGEAFDFCVSVLGRDRPVSEAEEASVVARWPVASRSRS